MAIEAPRGTQDMLPAQSGKWHALEAKIRELCKRYGFREIRTPVFEHTELFQRGVGDTTDLTELTPYALRELVKAVYVEVPDKSSGKRKQKVHIEYDLVGYIPVDKLIKAEQA